MKEIELKAHVKNVEGTKEKLNSFAAYKGFITREDFYYCNPNVPEIKIRVRKEASENEENIFLTYKKKSFLENEKTECNEEKECIISSELPLTNFFQDSGIKLALTKTKKVHEWKVEFQPDEISPSVKGANLELCEVSSLGYFLEIEILCSELSEEIQNKAVKKLQDLLALAGISKEEIECKTYSQMIEEEKNV